MMTLEQMKGVSRIHCVGIGDAGMSGIAEILKARGYQVTGSDITRSETSTRLTQLGISIVFYQDNHDVASQADLLVYSSAIPPNHPERQWAESHKIPCLSRGQMLGVLVQGYTSIAVAGTHGKTSTVGLISQLLRQHHLDPTIVIGGYLNSIKSNAIAGSSEYFITEADESDGSLLFLRPNISVVTNVDADHMGHYGHDFNRLVETYRQFIAQSQDTIVLCQDDPVLYDIIAQNQSASIISYGFEQSAMVRGIELEQFSTHFRLRVSREKLDQSELIIQAPLLGKHNAYNVLAAVAVASCLSIPDDVIQVGLEEYTGVARRLEMLGTVTLPQGEITLINDYGHHPSEVDATMQAVRAAWPQRRLVLVFQPHRYTRTRDLLLEFAKTLAVAADCLLLLPIYAAYEEPIAGVDHNTLASAISQQGGDPILVKQENLYQTLHHCLKKDDIVVFQGAGNIGQMVKDFKERWV